MLFDLLYVDGFDLRKAALLERKRVLGELLSDLGKNSPIKYSKHLFENGKDIYSNACTLQLEGIVSKRKTVATTILAERNGQ